MARFTIVDKRFYTVSNTDLNVFNITIPNDPVYSKKVNVGTWNVETIFPFSDKLFIGSQNGMFVYNINNPDNPALTGLFSHVQSCDPVIADDDYAYVTLRTGSVCFGNEILLQKNYSLKLKTQRLYFCYFSRSQGMGLRFNSPVFNKFYRRLICGTEGYFHLDQTQIGTRVKSIYRLILVEF